MAHLEDERLRMGSMYGSEEVRFPSLATNIQRRLKETPQYSRRRCIYRVPNLLRQTNEKAYTPLLVSIGPLHHNDKRLLPMEAHKLKYLQSFLCDPQANTEVDLLNLCIGIVKNKETQIRECFADPISLSSDEFSEMILIDSTFIIQLFRKYIYNVLIEDDYMYASPFLLDTVLRDIKLEENQLPFFILDELYQAAFQANASSSNSIPSFTEVACVFLDVDRDNSNEVISYFHLLHMITFHSSPSPVGTIVQNTEEAKAAKIEDFIFPPATELHEAGIKFQVIKNSSCWLSIEFDKEKGILKMPKFMVNDHTEYKCRNLIAFEQCHYDIDKPRYFTDYHFFLNCIINTPEDVKLLVDAGIIHNFMGSLEQVAHLINSLDTLVFIFVQIYSYAKITPQLQGHCKKRWNRYRATLMHTYFKHPWAAISVVYAIVLLLLTIAQLVVGIMAIP